jgi:hypothetical protein
MSRKSSFDTVVDELTAVAVPRSAGSGGAELLSVFCWARRLYVLLMLVGSVKRKNG